MNDRLIQAAIDRVRLAYDALQYKTPGEKLYVAYSGGKDSDALMRICRDAVPAEVIEPHYHPTGIDPPEIVKHVKEQFRRWEGAGIECHFDKMTTTMYDLIVKKGPPRQDKRFCCEYFKEGGGYGRIVLTGVRWAESKRRSLNHGALTVMSKQKNLRAVYNNDNDISRMMTETCPLKARYTINPLIDWQNTMPIGFLKERDELYCCLYDQGWRRLGCIGCPSAGLWQKTRDFARWPHIKRYYMRAFEAWLTVRPYHRKRWETAEDVFHWWMNDGYIKGQMEFDFEEG